jgi:hypothetical protein
MKKLGTILLIILGILLLGYFVILPMMKKHTKKQSPETTIYYEENGYDLSLYYNQPSMKGRKIFGGLVPYGEVWRTGANEATAFNTTKEITIAGEVLPAGTYTIWTIPEKDHWTVIFNSKSYKWGVTLKGTSVKPSREPAYDVLKVKVPVNKQNNPTERFTIAFEIENGLALTIAWENIKIKLPIK